MADKQWKQVERIAAALFGGVRHWANAGERLDFESDTAIGQVKNVKRLSLENLTQLAEEMEREALPKGKAGVVCVKVRRGKGKASPMLVVVTAAVWEAMSGKRTEQIDSALPLRPQEAPGGGENAGMPAGRDWHSATERRAARERPVKSPVLPSVPTTQDHAPIPPQEIPF